jgi:Iap family predicted aminopeptidase
MSRLMLRELDRHVCATIMTSDEALVNLRTLCLKLRGRFSGTRELAEAAQFINSRLRRYGVTHVWREWYEMTQWRRGRARLELLSPVQREFPCLALPYAPSCHEELELVDAGMGHPGDFAARKSRVPGCAVLVDDENPHRGPSLHRLQKYLLAREAGASAFLFAAGAAGMLAPTGSLAFDHRRAPDQALPAVGIPREVARELRALAEHGPLRIRLVLENELAPGRDCNVIGELQGSNPDERLTVVCAHYDGHDIAHGAVDNASGTVALLEIARALAPWANQLRGRVRLIFFGSEEMGLVGSHDYVREHRDELPRIRYLFNLDCVGNPGPLHLLLQDSPELIPVFREFARELPADIEIHEHLVPFSDHFPFALQGVPCAFVATPGSGGRGYGHTVADTFDKVSLESLQRTAAHIARLVLRVDHAESWPARPRAPEELRRMLASLQLEPLLRYEGHWPFAETEDGATAAEGR